MGTPLCQGVTRPQLILAVVSAEILQMRLTSPSPSSGCMKSTLMLVKRLRLWWREVFCRFIVSCQIAGNEHWEVVGPQRSPSGSFPNIGLKDQLKSVDSTEFSQCDSPTTTHMLRSNGCPRSFFVQGPSYVDWSVELVWLWQIKFSTHASLGRDWSLL